MVRGGKTGCNDRGEDDEEEEENLDVESKAGKEIIMTDKNTILHVNKRDGMSPNTLI